MIPSYHDAPTVFDGSVPMRLFKKATDSEPKLAYLGHLLMENRTA